MGILKDFKRYLRYERLSKHLQTDENNVRDDNRFVVFDTSLHSQNLGDEIINSYCQDEFLKMKLNIIHRIPTHCAVSDADNRILLNEISTAKIITGTNVLCKHVFDSNQWEKPIIDKRLSHLLFMGVGLDNYNEEMDIYTKRFYQAFLDKKMIHSVRDSASEVALKKMGIENVVNTACPTMWNLTPEFCKRINKYKTDDVITTVTEYDKSALDFAILDILLKHYRNVYLWLQGEKDLPYIKKYHNYDKLKIISYNLCEYNTMLRKENIEYIGTRLHGGIHALNNGKRTLIIAVDGRGLTIGKDTNLPIVNRVESIDRLESLIKLPRDTNISLPVENIDLWRRSICEYRDS